MKTALKSLTILGLLAAPVLPVEASAGSLIPGAAGAPDRHEVRRSAYLADVLGVLERSKSPIAGNTLATIRSGAIVLDTLDRLHVEDCRTLIHENPRQWNGVVDADECIEGQDGLAIVPKKILERVSGYQTENRIYVRPGTKLADAAVTVVHETNHVLNATHEHYGSAHEKLEEEYRAYWVALLFTDGKAPNAGYLNWLKGWIVEQYALEGVCAAEIPDRPAGNLDNALQAVPLVSLAPEG